MKIMRFLNGRRIQNLYFEKLDNLTEEEQQKLPKRIFVFGIGTLTVLSHSSKDSLNRGILDAFVHDGISFLILCSFFLRFIFF